jgi:hypothetical protein
LIASIVFTIGFLPDSGSVSLDVPAEIDMERLRTITRRKRFSVIGLIVYGVAVASGVLICTYYLAHKNSATPMPEL